MIPSRCQILEEIISNIFDLTNFEFELGKQIVDEYTPFMRGGVKGCDEHYGRRTIRGGR